MHDLFVTIYVGLFMCAFGSSAITLTPKYSDIIFTHHLQPYLHTIRNINDSDSSL